MGEMGLVKIVEVLLDAGADITIGKEKTTPLTVAYQKGNKEILAMLFKASFQTLEASIGTGAPVPGPTVYGGPVEDDVDVSAVAGDQLSDATKKLLSVGAPRKEHIQAAPQKLDDEDGEMSLEGDDRMREDRMRDEMKKRMREANSAKERSSR